MWESFPCLFPGDVKDLPDLRMASSPHPMSLDISEACSGNLGEQPSLEPMQRIYSFSYRCRASHLSCHSRVSKYWPKHRKMQVINRLFLPV